MEEIPEGFKKILNDFLNDIEVTYPELKEKIENIRIDNDEKLLSIYTYCKEFYPERFFDILYQNNEIFNDDTKNLHFLPNIDFKNIWNDEISENTKEVIWKYLQLILFTVVGNVDNTKFFGETSRLFEAIDEESLKSKLEETIKSMSDLFDMSGNNTEFPDLSGVPMNDLPDPEELHNHISDIMGGKLGQLANEIAEETANELDIDLEDASNIGDVFQRLFKNPGKLINMVKKVGNKIEQKIKSGELKESELMEEAQEMMKKMNGMPGMKNFQKMFGQMGMPMNGKMNMNHFNSVMHNNIKLSKQKERMLEKLRKRKEEREKQQQEKGPESFNHSVFKGEEKMEKSKRVNNKKKKRRRKKKKKV
tara:strand:+ start:1296 stop:2387 length:1092 start_codon:yes stop_codon:yes gene_type:complete